MNNKAPTGFKIYILTLCGLILVTCAWEVNNKNCVKTHTQKGVWHIFVEGC